VNVVNPHDVMYYNTDAPGSKPVQEEGLAFPINREPAHALYQRRWDMPLPDSHKEPWDQAGRPRAHYDFQYARRALVGQFPNEDARWRCRLSPDTSEDRVMAEPPWLVQIPRRELRITGGS
jgi:arylsulfatase